MKGLQTLVFQLAMCCSGCLRTLSEVSALLCLSVKSVGLTVLAKASFPCPPSVLVGASLGFARFVFFLLHFRVGKFPLLLLRWRVMFQKDRVHALVTIAEAEGAVAGNERQKKK